MLLAEREEDVNEIVKTLLKMFSKYDVKILVDLVEEKPQNNGCA